MKCLKIVYNYFIFYITNFFKVQGYTEKMPKFKHRGNDRHFFHKPKKEYLIVKQEVYPTLSDYESAEKLYNNLFSIFSKFSGN